MRISPYDFKNVPTELIDFKDEVTSLLNQGKYQVRTLIEGTPTWKGQEGEQCFAYINSAGGTYNFYTYYYVNSAWRWTIFVGNT